MRQGNLCMTGTFLRVIVDSSRNMHNTGILPDCHPLSVTDGSLWIPYLARYLEILKKPNLQVGARGKRRGFSPGAAAHFLALEPLRATGVGPESIRIFNPDFWSVP